MTFKQAKKENKIIDYVFHSATNDKGMTGRYKALFHTCNPNGNYKLCSEWGWEAYKKGGFSMGAFAGSYELKKLDKLSDMKKPRLWMVNHYVDSLYEEAVRWAEKVKDVENRTDEEVEYFNNFINKGGK